MKISIITATFNCEKTIEDCLASVARQTWLNREHVVIDGKSKDGTLTILKKHCDQLDVLISEPDKGIYDALNKGIANSAGDVIGFLHADDLYAHNDVLADVAHVFVDESVMAVYGNLQYVKQDDTSQVVRYWKCKEFSPRRLSWGWMPPHPTLYVRREWYEKINGFDTRYRISADYFSILKFFSNPGFKAVHIPKLMVKMRVGGASNWSLKNLVPKYKEDFDAIRRSGVGVLGGWGTLGWKVISKVGQFAASSKNA